MTLFEAEGGGVSLVLVFFFLVGGGRCKVRVNNTREKRGLLVRNEFGEGWVW